MTPKINIKKIRDYYYSRGLSQRKFAAACGISNQTLSSIEKGKRPRASTLMLIAKEMGIEILELIEDSWQE